MVPEPHQNKRDEDGKDRKLGALPKASGGILPWCLLRRSTQKASDFSQTLLSFFFSRMKTNRMIHSLIKSIPEKKGSHPNPQSSVH
jgi:hypothetical protein